MPRRIVIVEGPSDRMAVETLAMRRGRDLRSEGVEVVPAGGAQGMSRVLAGLDLRSVRVSGLCDAGEERHLRDALERAGLGIQLSRAEMERLGFFVCDPDLEAELIRALGAAGVEDVVAATGRDLARFRTLQKQPPWRAQPLEEQLRRFLGSGARRKIQYARALVEALDLATVPRPLDALVSHVASLIG